MRFVGIAGTIAKVRRFVSGSASVQDEDVKDEKKLAEILRHTLLRVTELEARLPPEGVEFEVAVGNLGSTTSLFHNLGQPVRWWVTCWTRPVEQGAYPVTGPDLIQDASSDTTTLVLQSYTAGRAVIRIEPSVGAMEA